MSADQDDEDNDLEGSFFSKIATLRHSIMQTTYIDRPYYINPMMS